MWVMYPDGSGAIDPDSIELFMDGIGLIVDLKAGPGGDLFYVSYGEWDVNTNSLSPNSGALKRIEFFSDNQPPTAQLDLDPAYGPIPLQVFFDGSGSSDPDGDPLTYAWDLDGDGAFDDATGTNPFKTYWSSGQVDVGLEVSDGEFVDRAFATINPGTAPPTASIDAYPAAWETGQTITLQGSATDPNDGPLTGDALEWDILLQHCNEVDSCHTHTVTSFTGDEVSFLGPEHEYPSFLQARLTATNSGGLSDSVLVDLLPASKQSPVRGGVGIVQANGKWNLRDADGDELSFFFGQAGDYPFMGDWDCDGVDTPGLYRQTDGLVYLSNTNSFTNADADVEFIFGIAGDIPIAGDFNGDGCDTVSVFRNGHVFIINQLGADGGALFTDFDYFFGDPGDTPFTGDFDNDGIDELGLFRETTGLAYFALAHPAGGAIVADVEFFFGLAGDRVVADDWTNDGTDTVGIFRASDGSFYLSYVNELRFADKVIAVAWSGFPVAGQFDF
jgi:hypothetical protein